MTTALEGLDWLDKYELQEPGKATVTPERYDAIFDSKNNVRMHINNLIVSPKLNNEDPFYWPFGEAYLRHLDIMARPAKLLVLNDWEGFPTLVKSLSLHGLQVETLKGVDRLKNLELLYIVGLNYGAHFNCGLLRLLKLPRLEAIIFANVHATRLELALGIVRKHLKDRDIVACQSAMLDAGLDEYAEL